MDRHWTVAAGVAALVTGMSAAGAQRPAEWPVHSMDRPQPPVADPGPGALPVPPPRDAVILFDGHDLARWRHEAGDPARWIVRDGWFEVVPGTGTLYTRDDFGDVQLHVEWMAPSPPSGSGQDRGNSGVYLQMYYEIQVLDSHQNRTYPDGQAAAVYGQHPPLVNAARPPGEWQSYDIVFRGARFDAAGRLTRPASVTVFHNGVLVQDHVTLTGRTAHMARASYEAHPERLPIHLQDHGSPVRFRNIWLRELP
jgi:hypothetical protein